MDVAASWAYRGGDGCADFFTQLLQAARPDLPETASVLEIGCAEFDWLTQAVTSWPGMTIAGIDARKRKTWPEGALAIHGDVLTYERPESSLDWVVAVSTIEHIGLGHYGDTKQADGDSATVERVWRWLKPGGWFTFDVPWNAGTKAYEVVGTSHRVYDDAAVESRLVNGVPWQRVWTGAAHMKRPQTLVTDTPRLKGGEQFYYRGFVWRKP